MLCYVSVLMCGIMHSPCKGDTIKCLRSLSHTSVWQNTSLKHMKETSYTPKHYRKSLKDRITPFRGSLNTYQNALLSSGEVRILQPLSSRVKVDIPSQRISSKSTRLIKHISSVYHAPMRGT